MWERRLSWGTADPSRIPGLLPKFLVSSFSPSPAWGYIPSFLPFSDLDSLKVPGGVRRLSRLILGRLVVRLKACEGLELDRSRALLYWYCWSIPQIMVDVMPWGHVTSHVMDLTWLGQFHIITHPASQGWLSHQSSDLPNLPNQPSDFQINLSNQPFESTFCINPYNQTSH